MGGYILTIGHISYTIESQEDVSVVLELLGWNYDRAKEAARRRAASRQFVEPEVVRRGW